MEDNKDRNNKENKKDELEDFPDELELEYMEEPSFGGGFSIVLVFAFILLLIGISEHLV